MTNLTGGYKRKFWDLRSADSLLQPKSCRALNEAGIEQIRNKSEVTCLHLAGELLARGCCGCSNFTWVHRGIE